MKDNWFNVKKFVLLLVLIPFLTFVLTISYFPDADALKSQGTPLIKYGSATSGIICGDRLCSEQDHLQRNIEKIAKKPNQNKAFLNLQ